jgi:hypothetical protein
MIFQPSLNKKENKYFNGLVRWKGRWMKWKIRWIKTRIIWKNCVKNENLCLP